MSTQQQTTLPRAVQGALLGLGIFLINLALIVPPSDAPASVKTLFALLGIAAIGVKYEYDLASQHGSTIPITSGMEAQLLGLTLVLSAISSYVAIQYPGYWVAALVISIIAAVIATVKEVVGQQPVPTPAPTPVPK